MAVLPTDACLSCYSHMVQTQDIACAHELLTVRKSSSRAVHLW